MSLNRAEIDRTKVKILNACAWKTTREMEDLGRYHVPPYSDLLIAWEREGRIIGVMHEGIRLYPLFQFDAKLEPLPIIAQVIERLGMAGDGWAAYAWFVFPNGWVSDQSGAVVPKDALDRTDELLDAASKYKISYFA